MKVLLFSLGIFLSLGILEFVLRIINPNTSISPGSSISDAHRRYKLRPLATGKTLGVAFKVNSFGFRDSEYNLLTKNPGTIRILCVGDSVTFGVGLPLEDTFPKQLERRLQARIPNERIEVINCGVPSYNTVSEYYFIKDEGIKFRPDLIIIEYVYNDSGFTPVLLASSPIADKCKDLLRSLYSYEFILEKIYRIRNSLSGLSAQNSANRVEVLKNAFSDTYIGWQKNKEAFKSIRELSRKNDIPVLYIIFPVLENLDNNYPYGFFHQKVREALSNEPYVLDLLPFFKERRAQDLWVTNYDSHPNKAANAIVSDAVARFIESKKIIRY